jgi:hypothetical protein
MMCSGSVNPNVDGCSAAFAPTEWRLVATPTTAEVPRRPFSKLRRVVCPSRISISGLLLEEFDPMSSASLMRTGSYRSGKLANFIPPMDFIFASFWLWLDNQG